MLLLVDAEKRRVMGVIQPAVATGCLYVDSCADADGAFGEHLQRFVRDGLCG